MSTRVVAIIALVGLLALQARCATVLIVCHGCHTNTSYASQRVQKYLARNIDMSTTTVAYFSARPDEWSIGFGTDFTGSALAQRVAAVGADSILLWDDGFTTTMLQSQIIRVLPILTNGLVLHASDDSLVRLAERNRGKLPHTSLTQINRYHEGFLAGVSIMRAVQRENASKTSGFVCAMLPPLSQRSSQHYQGIVRGVSHVCPDCRVEGEHLPFDQVAGRAPGSTTLAEVMTILARSKDCAGYVVDSWFPTGYFGLLNYLNTLPVSLPVVALGGLDPTDDGLVGSLPGGASHLVDSISFLPYANPRFEALPDRGPPPPLLIEQLNVSSIQNYRRPFFSRPASFWSDADDAFMDDVLLAMKNEALVVGNITFGAAAKQSAVHNLTFGFNPNGVSLVASVSQASEHTAMLLYRNCENTPPPCDYDFSSVMLVSPKSQTSTVKRIYKAPLFSDSRFEGDLPGNVFGTALTARGTIVFGGNAVATGLPSNRTYLISPDCDLDVKYLCNGRFELTLLQPASVSYPNLPTQDRIPARLNPSMTRWNRILKPSEVGAAFDGVFVSGGTDSNGDASSSVWFLNVSAGPDGTWVKYPDMPVRREISGSVVWVSDFSKFGKPEGTVFLIVAGGKVEEQYTVSYLDITNTSWQSNNGCNAATNPWQNGFNSQQKIEITGPVTTILALDTRLLILSLREAYHVDTTNDRAYDGNGNKAAIVVDNLKQCGALHPLLQTAEDANEAVALCASASQVFARGLKLVWQPRIVCDENQRVSDTGTECVSCAEGQLAQGLQCTSCEAVNDQAGDYSLESALLNQYCPAAATSSTLVTTVVPTISSIFGVSVIVAIVIFVYLRSITRDNSKAPVGDSQCICFTDIESSTKKWQSAPEDMSVALEEHNDIIRKAIRRHGAYEVKTVGDAFMFATPTAAQAIEIVGEIQRNMHAVKWKPTMGPNGLRIRVGFHQGNAAVRLDEVTKGYDYFGTDVNVSARLEANAKPGNSLTTASTIAGLEHLLTAARLVGSPRGLISVKGIAEPIDVVDISLDDQPEEVPPVTDSKQIGITSPKKEHEATASSITPAVSMNIEAMASGDCSGEHSINSSLSGVLTGAEEKNPLLLGESDDQQVLQRHTAGIFSLMLMRLRPQDQRAVIKILTRNTTVDPKRYLTNFVEAQKEDLLNLFDTASSQLTAVRQSQEGGYNVPRAILETDHAPSDVESQSLHEASPESTSPPQHTLGGTTLLNGTQVPEFH